MKKIDNIRKTTDNALKIANENKRCTEEMKEEIKKELREEFKEDFHKMKNYCENLESENVNLKGRMNHLDNYSRRNNLVIGGIREDEGAEQCDQLVRTFFIEKLKLSSDDVRAIKFVRCHRLGRHQGQHIPARPRSIIVRFCEFSDRQAVWSERRNLEDHTLSMNENFCSDTEFHRRKLYPIFRKAKSIEQYRGKVSLYEDTLYVNNKPYTVDNLDDLPDNLHPKHMCEKSSEDCFVFGGMYSEYSVHSNWARSLFSFKEKEFVCIEQGYMYHKAVVNEDPTAARKIRDTTNPREIKRLGSAIIVKSKEQWDNVKGNLMLELVHAKYSQNTDMKKMLLDTRNKKMGETEKTPTFP